MKTVVLAFAAFIGAAPSLAQNGAASSAATKKRPHARLGKFQDPANQYLFTVPETTVGELALELEKQLGVGVMRVVGDHEMKVTRVAFSPGAAGSKREIGALEMPDVQALIVGETREWETVEYVADAVSQDRHKR